MTNKQINLVVNKVGLLPIFLRRLSGVGSNLIAKLALVCVVSLSVFSPAQAVLKIDITQGNVDPCFKIRIGSIRERKPFPAKRQQKEYKQRKNWLWHRPNKRPESGKKPISKTSQMICSVSSHDQTNQY